MRGSVHRVRKGKHAGKWVAEVRAVIARRPYRQKGIFDSKRAADRQRLEWAAVVEEAKARERLGLPVGVERGPSPSFAGLCDEWIAGSTVRESTRIGYQRHIDLHLVPFFGSHESEDITIRHLRRFRVLLARSHRPKGVKRIEGTLRAILRYAERGGLIDRNPFVDLGPVRVPRGPGQEVWRVLTPQQQVDLLDAADDTWRPWFLMALRTGLRGGELRELRWGDLDLHAPGWVTVARRAAFLSAEKGYDVGPPKSGAGRRVPLASDLVEELERWPRTLGTDLVFPDPDWGDYRSNDRIKWAFRRALRRGAIPGKARPHDLRHSFASDLLARGADLETVRVLGGWSSLAMVQRYVHTGDDRMVDAVERLVGVGR